ncbi:hypothetical protein GXP67_22095 [Rhodocytophaga rosea]|uniref:Uncharacterized protein n=1 Tax=Rhodocytophaga rosea TaxID=2704465 RepID=A0A6C0GNE0_9BACT|nr:hypothetical protein [Rhodocytophaga rosea]QHT69140.1 hypothetical protein GXP67_22095 [Rhodocytophaga rosea]
MENIKTLQEQIRQKRDAYNKAELAYYQALQEWSLSQQGIATGTTPMPTPEDIKQKQTASNQALTELQAAISQLDSEGAPQALLTQIPSDVPFLLLPVRLEARYLTVQHVVRKLTVADTVDMFALLGLGGDRFRIMGFDQDEEGVTTYMAPPFHTSDVSFLQPFETWKPKSGNFIKRKIDNRELRIRIYPDDVFLEGLERFLQPGEWEAGTQFWKNIGTGTDVKEAWFQLSTTVMPARAAWIIRNTLPTNFSPDKPLPNPPQFAAQRSLKDGSYTYPPITRLLPERFTVRLYKDGTFKEFTGNLIPEPLVLGLDPTHDPFDSNKDSGMTQKGTNIQTPEYLRWIHDFEEAEKLGLGIRIDLNANPEFSEGVDKILVVGAKLSVDDVEGARLINELLENHLFKEEGLGILPKGTPTNNFEGQKSAFNKREQDANLYFQSQWLPAPANSLETDESRLKKALGLKPDFRIPNGHCTDLSEAMLMNQMLWPATWGYYLLQFFTPDLDEASREQARHFFINHVSGRGTLPVLRVNRQPYGIIPVSSYAHWLYPTENLSEEDSFASQVWTLFLSKLNTQWQTFTQQVRTVNNVGGSGLDDQFFEMLNVSPSAAALQKQWLAGIQLQQVMQAAQPNPELPTELNSDPDFSPALFSRQLASLGLNTAFFSSIVGAYSTTSQKVRRILLDKFPITENQLLERIAGKSWNYLEFLSQGNMTDIWNHNLTNIPAGDGPELSNATLSVFAVLARQAVLRAYLEDGIHLAETNPGLWLLKVKDFEAQHLHTGKLAINPLALAADNKLHQGYQPIIERYGLTTPFELEVDRRLYFATPTPTTGTTPLSDWLNANRQQAQVPVLSDVTKAAEYFSQVPVKRIEHLFTEHLDLCSHRLDAWIEGIVYQRLLKQRKAKPQGLYLGAFGYLLGLKPNLNPSIVLVEEAPEYIPAVPENMEAAAIPLIHSEAARQSGIDPAGNSWEKAFFYIGETFSPNIRLNTVTGHVEPNTSTNQVQSDGFIHAPSTAHATAAAILRSGYLNHQADNQTALVAIQLNSPRIRQALQLLEGMQQGASVGELLGYYFERLLHERQLDRFLYDLRKAFPIQRTESNGQSPSPLTTIDGLRLLNSRRANPTGWLSGIPGITPTDTNTTKKINEIAQTIEDYLDALSDLLLTESVYQMANGNKDRAAAALRILNSGGQVILPDVVRTPLKGNAITHRVGVVFKQNLPTANVPGWTATGSPRSLLAPDLNHWLSLQLPAPASITVSIKLLDGRQEKIKLSEVAIEPIDLLYALPGTFTEADQSPLAFYVQSVAINKFGSEILLNTPGFSIDFKDRSGFTGSEVSIFEISSLVAGLRRIISESRPISANDFLLPDKRAAASDKTDVSRLKTALIKHISTDSSLPNLIQQLRKQASLLQTALEQAQAETALQPIIKELLQALLKAWQYGIETSTSEGMMLVNQETAKYLLIKAKTIANELESRLQKAQSILTTIPATGNGETAFKTIQETANILFGKTISLYPDITLENLAEVNTCYTNRQLIENADVPVIDEWIREAALVRKPLRSYRQSKLLSEVLDSTETSASPAVMQFPFFPGNKQPWIGGLLPPDTKPEERASLSLLLELPSTFQANTVFSGFIIDEWPEWIPEKNIDTGVAFQYNQPNTEPPQTMLLAVTPVESENWNWEFLLGAVNDALEMAKKRLVTPEHIRTSHAGLSQVLPAIVMPFMPENQQTPVVEPV